VGSREQAQDPAMNGNGARSMAQGDNGEEGASLSSRLGSICLLTWYGWNTPAALEVDVARMDIAHHQ
jgi:hypothetical protein